MAAQKRAQLLETAERLFYDNGFHATGIDRIVQAAGVVRMTLYNHFSSKEALIAAVLDDRHERFLDRIDQAVAAAPAGGRARALVEAYCVWLDEASRRGCIMVRAIGEFAESSPRLHAQAVRAKTDLLERVSGALTRDGLRDGSLARRVFLLLEGANAAFPVLGGDAALTGTRRAVEALLQQEAAASAGPGAAAQPV